MNDKLQFPMTPSLRIRTNTAHGNLSDVWILGHTPSGIEFGLLHGTISEEHAELLAATLGLPVVREVQKLTVTDGAVEVAAERTRDGDSQENNDDGTKSTM